MHDATLLLEVPEGFLFAIRTCSLRPGTGLAPASFESHRFPLTPRLLGSSYKNQTHFCLKIFAITVPSAGNTLPVALQVYFTQQEMSLPQKGCPRLCGLNRVCAL